MHYVGAAKQASDYITVTNYLINYIRRTYEQGRDIAKALEDLKHIDFDQHAPVLKVSKAEDKAVKEREDRQFEKEHVVDYTQHKERIRRYEEHMVKAEALFWNQCESTMKSRIQSRTNYLTGIKGDPVELLKAIKEHALSYDSTEYRMKTICDAIKAFINLKQRDDELELDFLTRFKAARDVFYSHVGKYKNFSLR